MSSSHVYADGSAGYFRLRVSDGTHTHIQRIHSATATIDNATDPGSPTNQDTLINPEGEVNRTARNYMALMRDMLVVGYTITLQDFQGVSGGAPSGPAIPLQPYSLGGTDTGTGIPEGEITLTFRDSEGAPVRFVYFGGGTLWVPTSRPSLSADWAGNPAKRLAAYLTGVARTGGTAYPAGMSGVRSHHGLPPAISLGIVSGLNNRLRRAYHVK